LAAVISIFELAQLTGSSVAMIDERFGHLARDSEAASPKSRRTRLQIELDFCNGGAPCPSVLDARCGVCGALSHTACAAERSQACSSISPPAVSRQ
jgi:hypothetical protein